MDQIIAATIIANRWKKSPHRWSDEIRERLRKDLDDLTSVTPSVLTPDKAAAIAKQSDSSYTDGVVNRMWRALLQYFPEADEAAVETPVKVLSVNQGRLLLGCKPGIQGRWVCMIEYAPPADRVEKEIDLRFNPRIDFPDCNYVELDESKLPVVISIDPLIVSLFKDGWLRVKLINFDGKVRVIQ